MPRRHLGDVVVLLPGLTGSVLRKDGKDLWGPSIGALLGTAMSRGKRLRPLLLREDPVERDDLGDGVVATRVFPDVHLIPGLWKIDGYSKLAETLRRGLGLVPGRNYFEFPYDWRRDIRVAGRLLARRAHGWLARWRQASGSAAIRGGPAGLSGLSPGKQARGCPCTRTIHKGDEPSACPVFPFEAWDAAELAQVVAYQRAIAATGMGGDE